MHNSSTAPASPPANEFKDTLIKTFTNNGTIDRGMLFDRPFTDINQRGLSRVFKDEDTIKIIGIMDGLTKVRVLPN